MLSKYIIGLGALAGIAFAVIDISGAKPMTVDEMALIAEIDFHCERLDIQDARCGACERMGRNNREICTHFKAVAASDYDKYYRHPALRVLDSEVQLALLQREKPDAVISASTVALH